MFISNGDIGKSKFVYLAQPKHFSKVEWQQNSLNFMFIVKLLGKEYFWFWFRMSFLILIAVVQSYSESCDLRMRLRRFFPERTQHRDYFCAFLSSFCSFHVTIFSWRFLLNIFVMVTAATFYCSTQLCKVNSWKSMQCKKCHSSRKRLV